MMNGIRGLALSLHTLEAGPHDSFVGVRGAWQNTIRGAAVLRERLTPVQYAGVASIFLGVAFLAVG